MTSSQRVPYVLGYTHATMARYSRLRTRKGEPSLKAGLSADRGLQPARVKMELLVTAYQQGAVNAYPGLVHTARHVMGVGNA